MITALYTIEYENSSEPAKVFIQQRPAVAMFNREAKRLRMNDVTWDSVTCKKYVIQGTPRSIASQALFIGSVITQSEKSVRQILSDVENESDFQEILLHQQKCLVEA
tara:strand:+ start:6099 stop:6419 length:321 start_codon:yes stop_codon:yes gene_type:complete